METEILAYHKFPLPNGTDYFGKDLNSSKDVVNLFNYCQILEANILETGWEFLFKKYSLKEFIEIDKESGWFDDEDEGETLKSLFYHSLLSGFNPLTMQYGNYFEFTNVFQSLEGETSQIDWGKIYNLKNEL
ncbi:hypothetical protein Fleli_1757 [Bernardetia litoralis DSM 6794]|uniref:Uncharacterized protein n=1 Tax=Bernardetia litoralis (strain ATCC 23117 / DSM 6794 / NBRC 15988 / NCIMB 1366 / Fx l1 / Sio-4) TaxID=880071 RepID=I4AJM1_BERLS|nr:hypothetical protein [Bernardetia litoralis]AFM04156.1 hypothetical protein Fleli_1757 [Bernardetia litoralis DSM 6794]